MTAALAFGTAYGGLTRHTVALGRCFGPNYKRDFTGSRPGFSCDHILVTCLVSLDQRSFLLIGSVKVGTHG